MSDENEEYRQQLIVGEYKIGESFDKLLLTLSGGSIGISMTFIKNFVGDDGIIICREYLLAAWGFWATSLSVLLLGLYSGQLAHREAIKQHDLRQIDPDPDDTQTEKKKAGGIYSTIVNVANLIGMISFILGLISIIKFSFLNL